MEKISMKENRLVYMAGGPEQPFNYAEGKKMAAPKEAKAEDHFDKMVGEGKEAFDEAKKAMETRYEGAKNELGRKYEQWKNKWAGKLARAEQWTGEKGQRAQDALGKLGTKEQQALKEGERLAKLGYYKGQILAAKPGNLIEKGTREVVIQATTALNNSQKALDVTYNVGKKGLNVAYKVGKRAFNGVGTAFQEEWEKQNKQQ